MEDFPERKFIRANGVTFAAYEQNGDPLGKSLPILLLHGWPEIAYSWRNQIDALADTGRRVIAIDLKGFGWSDAPEDPQLYNIENITTELAALLDQLEIDKAIFCGHDWGGSIVWSMGQWRPDRVAGIIGVCTPLRPRPPAPPIAILKKRFGEKHYFVQFQKPGVAETIFAKDVERFVQMMFRKPPPQERWAALIPGVFDLPGRFQSGAPAHRNDLIVARDELDVYIQAYRQSGFHGGINYYRNVDRNWELMEGRKESIEAPGLWIGAALDLFLPPESADGMEQLVPDLEKKIIDDSGHWVMWEQPQLLNRHITSWLKRRFSI